MKVKAKIIEIEEELKRNGFNVLLPIECMRGMDKIIASRAHFDRICDSDNEIILIINASKGNIDNYIGPNTFA